MRTKILYQFVIGGSLIITDEFDPTKSDYKPIRVEDNVDEAAPNAYLFNEHDMKFRYKKSTKDKQPNKLEITLFNLDDDVVDYLTTNSGNNLCAILDVGDDDVGLSNAFKGTVTTVVDDFSSEDRKTKITVEDSRVNMKQAMTVRTFSANTPIKTIITEVSKNLQLPLAPFDFELGNTTRPVSVYGNTMQSLQNFVSRYGLEVSIQDGEVEVMEKTKRLSEQTAFISAATGLVGVIKTLIDDTKSSGTNTSSESNGVSFECLLDATIKPNTTVYLQDGEFDRAYKVTTVVGTGSTRNNDWLCQVQATETAGEIV